MVKEGDPREVASPPGLQRLGDLDMQVAVGQMLQVLFGTGPRAWLHSP